MESIYYETNDNLPEMVQESIEIQKDNDNYRIIIEHETTSEADEYSWEMLLISLTKEQMLQLKRSLDKHL